MKNNSEQLNLENVYITKYALTRGIIFMPAEILERAVRNSKEKFCRVKSFNGYTYFFEGQYYLDKEEAIEAAERMRERKIESLKKQINKLRELKFE